MKIRIVSDLAALRENVAQTLRGGGCEVEAVSRAAPEFCLAYRDDLDPVALENLTRLLAPFAPELRPTAAPEGWDAQLQLGPANAFAGCRLQVEANAVGPAGALTDAVLAETGLEVLPPVYTDEVAGEVRFDGAPPFAWQTIAWLAAKAGFPLSPRKVSAEDDPVIRVGLVDAGLEDAPLKARFGVRIEADDLAPANELREWLEDGGFEAVGVQLLDESRGDGRRFSLAPGPFGDDSAAPELADLVGRCERYVASCGVDPARFPFRVRRQDGPLGLEARVTLPFRALEEGRLAPYAGAYPERFRLAVRTDAKSLAVGLVEGLKAKGFVNVGSASSIGADRNLEKGFLVEWGCAARFSEVADGILATVRDEMARLGCSDGFTVSTRKAFDGDDPRVRIHFPVGAALDGSLWEHLPKPADYRFRLYTPDPDGWKPLLEHLRKEGFAVGTSREEPVDSAKVAYGGAPPHVLAKLQKTVARFWGEEVETNKKWGDSDPDLWLYLPLLPDTPAEAPPVRLEERLALDVLALGKGAAGRLGDPLLGLPHVLLGALLSEEGRALVAEALDLEQGPTLEELGGRFAALEAPEIRPVDKRFSMTVDLKRMLKSVQGRYGKLKAAPLVKETLTALQTDPDWGAAFAEAVAGMRKTRHVRNLARLRGALDRVAELREVLSDRVLGQERVIERVCDAYLSHFSRSEAGGGPRGPRMLLTLVGPPGVGKTLLGETLAAHLGEDGGMPVLRLDLSVFAGAQNHDNLVGASSFYQSSRKGLLTEFVEEHPEAFVLLEDLDRAHENTQNLLGQVIDTGSLLDRFHGKTVDFSRCTLIVTTSLGRELYDSPNRAGVLQSSENLDSVVLEALRKEGGAERGFSPDVLSRLARGSTVLFQYLDGLAMARIATQTFERTAASLRKEIGLRVEPPQGLLQSLFILRFGAGGDARRMDSSLAKYVQECVGLAVRAHPEVLEPGDGEGETCYGFRFRLAEGESTPDEITAHVEGPTRVLLIDDDPWSQVFEPPFECVQVGSREAADRVLAKDRADLVLLDLHLGSAPGEDRRDAGLAILSWLRERFPAVPVYLFSEHPEKRGLSPEILQRVRIEGGARGVLQKQFYGTDEEKTLLARDSFFRQLAEADAVRRRQGLVESYQRKARVVEFDISARPEAMDEAGLVPLEISRVRETTAVSAMDRDMHGWVSLPEDRFEGIKGAQGAKKRLEEVVSWLGDPEPLRRFGLRIPRGILLTGPPGTGKTSLARAVAGEAGAPFFAISGSDPGGQADKPPEQYLRDLFACARRYAPAVIFIDEIDSLGRKREEGVRAGALNELLAQLDGFQRGDRPLFVLAATNRPDVLDPALVRPGRFDITIEVGVPGPASRMELFEIYLRGKPLADTVAVDELATRTAGMSGAQIEQVCIEAAMQAMRDHRKDPERQVITQVHLQEAVNTVRLGIAAETPVLAAGLRRATAVHEAGHALLQRELFPEQPVTQVTILPRGHSLGSVESRRDGIADTTPEDVRRQMLVKLAGRAAEELLLGGDQITNGCADDLEKATALAARAVSEWGFDSDIGVVSLDGVRVGLGARKGSGESTRALEEEMTGRIRVWLSEAQDQCRKLLEERRGKLEKLADTLLDRETIYRDELDWVLSSVADGE